jgi:hypothetical protein
MSTSLTAIGGYDYPAQYDRYEIMGGRIFTDSAAIALDYTYDAPESTFPAYFQQLLETNLAAVFAGPIAEKADFYEQYYTRAFGTPSEKGEGGLYRMARQIDSRQQPGTPIPTQALTYIRYIP